jgi:hypothetical protein
MPLYLSSEFFWRASMQDFDYTIGTHPFSVRVQRKDRKLRFGMTVERTRGEWTEVLGDRLVEVDGDTLLSALISFWPKIAGPYAGFPATKFLIDLSLLAGFLPEGKAQFMRDGYEVSFSVAGHSVELGSESVIPVEVLLGLGNLLEADAPAHLQAMWKRASAQTQLPPFSLSKLEDMSQPDEDAAAETAWYATALGQDVDTYTRTANWLHARQLAFAVGHPDYTEPTQAEYDIRTIPKDLLEDEDIDAIYALSASKLGETVANLRRQAVAHRNYDTRNITVFRRFFPLGSKSDTASASAQPTDG